MRSLCLCGLSAPRYEPPSVSRIVSRVTFRMDMGLLVAGVEAPYVGSLPLGSTRLIDSSAYQHSDPIFVSHL